MGIDRKVERRIQEAKQEIYTRTSISNIRLRQKKIRVKIDMSNYIIEEILSIEYEDKQWRLAVYLSKSLNKTKKNYKFYNKEMLIVIRGLEN